ncbi:copper chaperone PCu(A)C [Sphingomicrobium sp. XHP0235]|uniref:copper chaperone PCu(A)C n=1 Tax=Sphingomicrobium aquimarinum TaxID=3133971 RepID=UPI0031FE5C49
MKINMSLLPALAALTLASCNAEPATGDFEVSDAWARATAPGQSSAAAYLTLTNETGADVRLIGVSTDIGMAALHRTQIENGIASMRPVEGGINIAAGGDERLEPQGDHIMIMGLEKPLEAGGSFTVTLDFEGPEDRDVVVNVVEPGAR